MLCLLTVVPQCSTFKLCFLLLQQLLILCEIKLFLIIFHHILRHKKIWSGLLKQSNQTGNISISLASLVSQNTQLYTRPEESLYFKVFKNVAKNYFFVAPEPIIGPIIVIKVHFFTSILSSSASTQFNSTSTQTKAEVSFILKQIQLATHPTDQTSRERRLKCQFQFQLKQRLMLGLFSNNFFSHPPTFPDLEWKETQVDHFMNFKMTKLNTQDFVKTTSRRPQLNSTQLQLNSN